MPIRDKSLDDLDVRVYVDYAQERQNTLGPYTLATDGTQLDAGSAVNCIIDPVTLSVMGKPLPMTAEWNDKTTPCTGHYYRFQISDFTFSGAGGSSNWRKNDYRKTGDTYIVCNASDPLITAATVSLTQGVKRNEPLFLSYSKLAKKEQDDRPAISVYWSNATNIDRDLKLNFKHDGSCDVFRGYKNLSGTITSSSSSQTVTGISSNFTYELVSGQSLYDFYGRLLGVIDTVNSDTQLTLQSNAVNTFTGRYFTNALVIDAVTKIQISGPEKIQSFTRTESNYSKGRPISTIANPNDQYNDVFIIPCRGKELLVLTSYGLNFSISFPDLNLPDPPANVSVYNAQIPAVEPPNISSQPIITPSGTFSIQIPNGKVQFQLAKLYFLDNWNITSQRIQTASSPPALPTYLTGTLSCDYGSSTITGTGTLFTSEISAGDRIYYYDSNNLLNSIFLGIVNTVTNNTTFTLTTPAQNKLNDATFSKEAELAGTIAWTLDSQIVTGTGTNFNPEISVGDWLYTSENYLIGQVAQINSDTELELFDVATYSGSGIFWKNLNQYIERFVNPQVEFFSSVLPTSTDTLGIDYSVLDGSGNVINGGIFNSVRNEFKLQIYHYNDDDSSDTASSDKGFMFYSLDDVYLLRNLSTRDSIADITDALETLSINRQEAGQLTLNLSGRQQLLQDAGMVNPDQIANRPVKVMLEPRRFMLTGTISKSGNDVVGINTLFQSELTGYSKLYLQDGTFIGYVNNITSNTALTLVTQNANNYADVSYSDDPIYQPISLFEGYLNSPEITYIQGPNFEKYSLLGFEAIDKLQRLNQVYYSEAPNFDSINLEKIFGVNLIYAGAGNNDPNKTDLQVTDTINTYQIPINRNNSNGQYNYVANLGDNVGGYLEKLRSDYAQNFTLFCRGAWVPSQYNQNQYNNFFQFQLRDLDYIENLFDTIPMDLFLSEYDAESLFGLPIYQSYKRTIRGLKRVWERPEANRIFIIGLDKTNGSRIQYLKEDTAAQNPYYSPADRPRNWTGTVDPYVMINDKLNCNTDVVQTAEQFYARLTPGREIIEFQSDLLTTWDYTSKFVPTNRIPLLGTITYGATNQVLGSSTEFTTELQVADSIFNPQGQLIGVVESIQNNSQLTLMNVPSISDYDGGFYNDYTVYLEQYNYLDIGDLVRLYDIFGLYQDYMIIDWQCDFLQEYITDENIPVRQATYRAKQIDIPVNNPPIFSFYNQGIPADNQWIITQGYEMNYVVSASSEATEDITYSLDTYPPGMVINANSGAITWTPTSLQQNKIFDVIVLAFDGTDSSEYKFQVRTYSTL